MLVHCIVQNTKGQALAHARVDVLDATRTMMATGITDAHGKVSLEGAGVINLAVYPPGWGQEAAKIEYTPSVKRITGTPRPDTTEMVVELADAIPVKIAAYDLDGKLFQEARASEQLNPSQVNLYDLQDMPASGSIHWSEHDSSPYLLLPATGARKIAILWTAPGYGRLVCWADNQGRGFAIQDGKKAIFLNRELALTAWRRLVSEYATTTRDGYSLSAEIVEQINKAEAAIAAMESVGDEQQQAQLADQALGLCFEAGEQLVFSRAKERIERHRKRKRTVSINDRFGKEPRTGMTVRYKQLAHDFKFGVFVNPDTHSVQRVPLKNSILWERLRDMGANLLPVPLLWSLLETEKGERKDQAIYDRFPARELREAGFHLKDHISIWFWHGKYPQQWGAFMPNWLYELTPSEIAQAVYEHKSRLVEMFGPHIQDWQAINEAMLAHTNSLNLTLSETIEAVQAGIRAVREQIADPVIEVNNCQVFGEMINFGVQEQGYEFVPDQFYETLLEQGVEFDTIGMQLYYGGFMQSERFSGGFPIRHPWDLESIIKRYSRFGKPIRITEVSVPSSAPAPELNLDFGYWHGPWDLERQAAWVEMFYTLCYSLPQVTEITWWNATDEGSFIKNGGLMSADYEPKPAAEMLGHLVDSWKSAGHSQVSSSLSIEIGGPAGEYELILEEDGEVIDKTTIII